MQSGPRSFQRTVGVVVALGISLGLTACSYVDRLAIRVNEDHSVDVRSCERLERLDQVRVFVDGGAVEAGEGVDGGDVLHLTDAVDNDEWESIALYVDGAIGDRPWTLDGSFWREHVTVGEWAWARTGVFIGTVPVEACEAGEPSR